MVLPLPRGEGRGEGECVGATGRGTFGPLHSQTPRQRRKAVVGEVFVQVQRVQPPIVFHGDVDLPFKEGLFAILANGQLLYCWRGRTVFHQQAIQGPRPELP